MSKNKVAYILVGILITAAVVGSIIIAVVLVKENRAKVVNVDIDDLVQDVDDVEVGEYYRCNLSAYSSTVGNIYMKFDLDTGECYMMSGSTELAYGTYTISKNKITMSILNTAGEETGTTCFLLDDGYLMQDDSIYSGEIPETDLFDTVAARETSSGDVFTYTFYEDGTYNLTEVTRDDKEYSEDGTYTRDGDVIERTLNGEDMIPFYVYQNHLVATYYEEISYEEYVSDMAEAETEDSEE